MTRGFPERCARRLLRRCLAAAYGAADMAILVGHGTLITASSVALALLRAQCFEHRSRKAWEVRALGLPGVPLPERHAARLAQAADVYADLLLVAYARRLRRTDPGALLGEERVATPSV